MLKKITRTSYVKGSPGVPASPGVPPSQAYTYIASKTVCTDTVVGGQCQTFNNASSSSGAEATVTICAPNGGAMGASTMVTKVCSTVKETVFVPASAGTPPAPGVAPSAAQTAIELNLGWNSGARSVKTVAGDAIAHFSIPAGVLGVIIGLKPGAHTVGFTALPHAFYFAKDIYRIYEAGALKFTGGLFATSDAFSIRRIAGVVSYIKNNVEVYTSATPSTGPAVLSCTLYGGGDTVL